MLQPHLARSRRAVLALLAAAVAVAVATAGPALAEPPAAPALLGGGLTQDAAAALVPAVTDVAGPALAGIWFAPQDSDPALGRLMVGTWEPALAPALGALGATPVVRDGPRRDPAAALRALSARTASRVPDAVADFGVDEVTQQLVVTMVEDRPGDAGLLDGLDPAAVRVVTTRSAPRLQAAIGGGDTISDGTRRCTVGFTATDGGADWLVTAGHCTRDSSTWYTGPDAATVVGGDARTADGPDAGAVRVDGGQVATPTVRGEPVRGMRVAPVGSTVCLSGSTSGRLCGPVTRRDVVVNFGGQQQSGLTAAGLCAREGDSGGSYTTPDGQAQGIHTGAGGPGCTSYYTPVGSAMGALGLTLRTG